MIVEFDYIQPGHKQHVIGRVSSVRDLSLSPLSIDTIHKSKYKIAKRGQYLVTVALSDGRFKQYYSSQMRNARNVGLARRVALWFGGVNFPKVAYV